MKKSMNVLFIAHNCEVGGATNSMMELITNLNKKNCNIIVATPLKGKVYNFCQENDIGVIVTKHKPFMVTDGGTKFKSLIRHLSLPLLKIIHNLNNLLSLKIIEKNLNMRDIDIIHTNLLRDDFGGKLAKKYNIKHIVHLREYGKDDYNCISYVIKRYQYMNSYTDQFIAISKSIKNYYANMGIPKNKIQVVYNGINVEKIKYEKKNYSTKGLTEILHIIFVGGITESKGQHLLVDAISRMSNSEKKHFKIDFYGLQDKKYCSKINKMIETANLRNIINVNSYCNNINEILCKYDIGIMCSKSEAFGRVTVEYMAAGLITIASNTGANKEIIENGINGFIFNYNDIDTLKNILISIFENYSKMERISLNAYNTVKEKFTCQNTVNKIYELYNNIKGWR